MRKKKRQKRRHGISAQPLIMSCITTDGRIFSSRGKGTAWQAVMPCRFFAIIWGLKALVCRSYDAHGQTLVFADGRFYVIVTGYNEPKPRSYSMYEISGAGLEKLAEENLIHLNYFYQ